MSSPQPSNQRSGPAIAAAILLPAIMLALFTALPSNVITTTAKRDPVYAGMVGQWQGTVEMRDHCDSTRRVKRPAKVRVTAVPESDALAMHVVSKDDIGRVVADTDQLQLDRGLTTARFGAMGEAAAQHYDVRVADSLVANAPLTFVMHRARIGDEIPAEVRETVTIAPGEIRILQETKRDGRGFEFQRAYVLRRIG